MSPISPENITSNSNLFTVKSKPEVTKLQELARGLSQGDMQAWETLYLHLGDSVNRFLKKILRSDDDAFDVTQEVFISLWLNHHNLDPEKNIKGYIFKIAKSQAIDFINDKKKRNSINTAPAFDNLMLDFAHDEFIMAEEAKILIGLALETMPKQRRKVFEMSRRDELSYTEIASKLNINKRTVENHIYNVMKRLKELLTSVIFFLLI